MKRIWWWFFEADDPGVAQLPNRFCATVRALAPQRDVVAQRERRSVEAALVMRTVRGVC